jgi:hypothetical protein
MAGGFGGDDARRVTDRSAGRDRAGWDVDLGACSSQQPWSLDLTPVGGAQHS